MRFESTIIPGVVVVDLERHVDERGFFARSWCADESTSLPLATIAPTCGLGEG